MSLRSTGSQTDHTTRQLVRDVVAHDLMGDGLLEMDEALHPEAPDGYTLQRAIGRGGGGIVYLAHDETLHRDVAIKFLTDTGRADLDRFRREARFAAKLNNPSIVQVFELGETPMSPFIAMQYIDGGNLADAALTHQEVLRVVREIAVALDHAHREGIVHRDIKPENILLSREGRAYLADFGIARSLDGALGDTISREGQIMGTPALMPPEQARGELQSIDGRSDIYGIGATLYRKLTGRYPFLGETIIDVLHAVIHNDPPLPRSINLEIALPVETIIVRCMRKRPSDRYQKISEVIEAIDRSLANGQTASGSSAWFRQLVGAHVDAPAIEDDTTTDDYMTVGMEVVRNIATWDTDLYRASGSLTRSFERLDAVHDRLQGILDGRPESAWARFYKGVVLFRRGRLCDALEHMERSIDRVGNLAGAYFEIGRLYLALYLRQHRNARRHISPTGVEHDLEAARGRLDQAVHAFGEARRLGGRHAPWQESYTKAVARLAESNFDSCVELCDQILADEPDLEEVWKLRGDAQSISGDEPFESYDSALNIRRSYFEALHAKAEAYLARGAIQEAREALLRAREIYPHFTDALVLLARTYMLEVDRGGAIELLDEAEQLARDAVTIDPESYDAVIGLAEVLLERGRQGHCEQSLACALTTLDEARQLPGCQNRVYLMMANSRLERARIARAEGRDPRPEYDAVLALCEHTGGMNDPDDQTWQELRDISERERALTG